MNLNYINKSRLKLLALSGITILKTNNCYTKEFEETDIKYEKIGKPEYASRLRTLLNTLNNGLKEHILNTNLRIVLFEVENFTKTSEYNIDNLGIRTNIRTPLEYFATSFSCFISYPNELKKNCPMTYNYYYRIMEDYLERYNTNLIR